MPTKRILVLANSNKKGYRCVAGIAVDKSTPATATRGAWLRPVGAAPEGELTPAEMRLPGSSVRPFQIVKVPLKESAASDTHPEDWLVTGEPWELVETTDASILDALTEDPPDLWIQKGQPSDRVTAEHLKDNPLQQSLYLVKVAGLKLLWWTEFNSFTGRDKRKIRATFKYKGKLYDFGLTDPAAIAVHCKTFPKTSEPAKEAVLGDDYAICVSLTPVFNGNHYKVVATILELA